MKETQMQIRGNGPRTCGAELPGVTIQDFGSPWRHQPLDVKTQGLCSWIIPCIFQGNLKSLWSTWQWFLCWGKRAGAAGHQPPVEKKIKIKIKSFIMKMARWRVWSEAAAPLIAPAPAAFLSSPVKVTGFSCCAFNAPFSALMTCNNKTL